MDKDLSEHAWVLLSDISTAHNEFLETFHHRHKSLPRPSDQVFKAKCHLVEVPIPNPSDFISSPTISTLPINPSYEQPSLFESINNLPPPTPTHDSLPPPLQSPT